MGMHLVPLLITVYNINKRHSFLSRYFGTKASEDLSYNNAYQLFLVATIGMPSLCILEIVCYFFYSYKFHPWIKMLKGGTLPEDTRGFMIKVEHKICLCNRKQEKSDSFELDTLEQQQPFLQTK